MLSVKRVIVFSILLLIIFAAIGIITNEPLKYGRIGKDTACVLGDGKYQIGKVIDGKLLVIYAENVGTDVLLRGVKNFDIKKHKLYVISDEGYAVANGKDYICKIFLTVEKQVFGKYKGEDPVVYLNSYNEFTEEEKKILEKLEKEMNK